MRRGFLLVLSFSWFHLLTFSQHDLANGEQVHLKSKLTSVENSYIQDPTLSIFFSFHDFRSAANVRATSLSSAIRNNQFGKISEMSPGLGLTYLEGIHKHFDVSITLSGSFLDYPFETRPQYNKDNFLLEGDVSLRGKMFSNKSWISPYLQLGVGSSFYSGYYAAFIPAGGGLQLSFFDEAYFLVNAQYRIPVTSMASYHFFYSIGVAGKIGRKKVKKKLQQVVLPVRDMADRDGDGVPDVEDVCPDTKGSVVNKGCP